MDTTEIYRSPIQQMGGYLGWVVKYADGRRTTVLQHREVMEKHLGRKLKSSDHVHHKDGNKQNNRLENLEILSATEHGLHHGDETRAEPLAVNCAECAKPFSKSSRAERQRVKRGSPGPFCSKSCAARNSRLNSERVSGPRQIDHGTDTAYAYWKCRCDVCRNGHAQRQRDWRSRNNG